MFMSKRSTTLKLVGLGLAGLGTVFSGAALAHADQTVESKGGINVFSKADNAYWFSLGGRLNLDEVIYSGGYQDKGNNFASGGNIRRALLKFGGGLGDDFSYNMALNFDGTNVKFNDLWLGASTEMGGVIDKAYVRVGQFTPPTSLDDAPNYGTLDNNVFMESALATSAFSTPSQVYGVQLGASVLDSSMLSVAMYQPSKQETGNFGNTTHTDRLGGSVRATFVPVRADDTVLHLGAVGRYQSVNKNGLGNAAVSQTNLFSTAPEMQSRQVNNNNATNTGNLLLNTGSLRIASYNVATLEALGIWGPISVEGEYYRSSVQRVPVSTQTRANNLRLGGGHLQAAYVLTGESRGYDFATGTLRNPKPADKCGAWEIAARYSFVNLNDQDINGGSEHNATVGLNWFVNDNVRLAANYIRANIRPTSAIKPAVAKRQLDIFGLRAAVTF